MLAVALALGSSLVYGLTDFIGGLKSRSLPVFSVLLVSHGAALALLVAIALARGVGPPDGTFLAYAAAAGLSEAIGVAALYRGLAVGTMSIVAPVGATAPVLPVVAAAVIGELPEPIQGAGLALIVVGIALISYTPPGPAGAAGRTGASVAFGLVTALGFGGFLIGMDAASEGGVAWALLIARLTSAGAFAALVLGARRPLGIGSRELPLLAGIGLAVIGADAMYAIASTKGLLSVVAVLASLYPVVTIALARVYLRERLAQLQQLGAAAAVAGAALVSAFAT